MSLPTAIRLRDEQWCIALLNTLSLDQVSAVLKAFNAARHDEPKDSRPSAVPCTCGGVMYADGHAHATTCPAYGS